MPAIEILAAKDPEDYKRTYIGFRPPLNEAQQAVLKVAGIALGNMPKQWDESTDYNMYSEHPLQSDVLNAITAEAAFVLRQAGYEAQALPGVLTIKGKPQSSIFPIRDRIAES